MKYWKSSILALLFIVAISCEQATEDQPDLTETQTIIINDMVYEYETQKDPLTGEILAIPGENANLVQEFFEKNENYSMSVNLDTDEIRFYTNIDRATAAISGQYAQASEGCNSGTNAQIVNPDCGNTGGGNNGGGNNTGGGNTGGGTDQFDACGIWTSVQLADASSGQGNRYPWPIAQSVLALPDFTSLPLYGIVGPNPVGYTAFNDVMTSAKLCKGAWIGIQLRLYEHFNYGGKSIVFTSYQAQSVVHNLNNYIMHSGFLGFGRENWDNEVSSAKVVQLLQ